MLILSTAIPGPLLPTDPLHSVHGYMRRSTFFTYCCLEPICELVKAAFGLSVYFSSFVAEALGSNCSYGPTVLSADPCYNEEEVTIIPVPAISCLQA